LKYPYFKYFPELVEAARGISSIKKELVLALLVAICFLTIINSSWKTSPDSALYLELGESVAKGAGYKFNGEWHTYVPPGYPFLVSIAAKLFGPSFLVYRVMMSLLGIVTGCLGYMLVLRLLGPDLALIIGGLFAVSNTLLVNSTFTTSDTLFTCVALLALIWASKQERGFHSWGSMMFGSLLTGIPALVRINGWGLPVSSGLFLFSPWTAQTFMKRIGAVIVFVVMAFLVPSLWCLHKMGYPVSYNEGAYIDAVTGRGIGTQCAVILGAVWEYIPETATALAGVTIRTGFLEIIIVLLALVGFVSSWRRGERLFTYLTAVQYGGLALSSAGSRYLLLLIPGLLLFLFQGIVIIFRLLSSKLGDKRADWFAPRRVLVIVSCVLLVTNVGQNIVTIAGARSAVESGGAESNRDKPFFVAARWLKANSNGQSILTMNPRIIRYLTGLPTVETLRSGAPEEVAWPNTRKQIVELMKKGKPGFIFLDNKNPALEKLILESAELNNYVVHVIPEASYGNRYSLGRLTLRNEILEK
jgi:4-amino-4-deoxy-L-arabinose transferase-like glycosyltransferase